MNKLVFHESEKLKSRKENFLSVREERGRSNFAYNFHFVFYNLEYAEQLSSLFFAQFSPLGAVTFPKALSKYVWEGEGWEEKAFKILAIKNWSPLNALF